MTKVVEHVRALELLARHPGWSDRRVAEILGVAPSTIGRWRWQDGLAPALKSAGNQNHRRRVANPSSPRNRTADARAREAAWTR